MSDRPNLPAPDQLAAVRAEMKRLETLEMELKQAIIADPGLREGVAWLAEVKTMKRSDVDIKELRHFHPDLVAEYTYPREITYVALSGISEDGEIIPARTFRKLEASQQ